MPDSQGYTDHESRGYPFQVADVHVVGPGYHLLAPACYTTRRPGFDPAQRTPTTCN
ncbi:BZ3500_MvSof-1268-A1-R1_Chr12-2g03865 [Microbotryum saponariae]|uniref:BZ3500_MvSof-1268-A1-R1_Chr12-2g03865 protein n=1 Tax=Microbotryum saponariae TaxID=289078 RepID=A0A2X0L000_9BASI|nr:BZ3500_MvSof-1268-A1-R1_Chr12-2g03865 [Microbotryum saponariae]SCZ99824.1 BZ3501_MvSof-1269-A2-R1_Chr12-2g03515 [Microbotryum saponariae]